MKNKEEGLLVLTGSGPEFVAGATNWNWVDAGGTAILNCMTTSGTQLAAFANPSGVKLQSFSSNSTSSTS